LRAAIGLAGNNRIDDDQWRYLYTINSTGGPGFGESTINGEKWYANASTFPNMKIKWETTLTRNVAFDLGLFADRVTITPEVYWNTTKDLLYRSDIPSVTGYSLQMQNIGQVTNRGFELTLNGDILRGKDYLFLTITIPTPRWPKVRSSSWKVERRITWQTVFRSVKV
jgi:outer membrane receptor protein involved in Fe transport